MQIIDAHHHFWDPQKNYHPWLRDEPMIPFRYGDYAPIRRRFLTHEYDNAARNWEVIASVTMEGEWDPADPTGEAIWIQELAEKTHRPSCHVAQAWLDKEDLCDTLDIICQLPIVKSVRHKPRSNKKPNGPPGGMMDQSFQNGFKTISNAGLMFDLQTPWWHLKEAMVMADLAPETPIILNHTGLPSDRSTEGIAGWREALKAFAQLPQTVIKISGLGLPNRSWSIKDNRDIIREAIDIFGPQRSMFGSNFPVDGLCGSFDTIFAGFVSATSDFSNPEKQFLFCKTAANTYKLKLPDIPS